MNGKKKRPAAAHAGRRAVMMPERFIVPGNSVLFAGRFTRATTTRWFTVLGTRFRRFAILTARRLLATALALTAASLSLPLTAAADRFELAPL